MIVGISGKRGVGKSLAASYLVKNHGFRHVSFAKDLKDIAKTLFPFSDNDLSIPSKKEKPWRSYDFSPRDFLIHLGEFMRFHDKNYWLNRAMANCKDPVTNNYVFDDVRYKNEADTIKSQGGMLMRVERYAKYNPYGKDLDGPSETDLDDYKFDYVCEKMWNTTQTDLFRQIDAFVTSKCGAMAVSNVKG
jgi:hypothetical protein